MKKLSKKQVEALEKARDEQFEKEMAEEEARFTESNRIVSLLPKGWKVGVNADVYWSVPAKSGAMVDPGEITQAILYRINSAGCLVEFSDGWYTTLEIITFDELQSEVDKKMNTIF